MTCQIAFNCYRNLKDVKNAFDPKIETTPSFATKRMRMGKSYDEGKLHE